MVILSKPEEDVAPRGARELYELLRGGDSQLRLGSRGTPISNESLQATSAVPLTTSPASNSTRVTATEASTTSQASASSAIQPSGGVEIPNQNRSDPSTVDPNNKTLYEVTRLFRTITPRIPEEVMADILMRYSLSLHGFPPCPKEDLMLAVYFYLEEKFGVQAKMVACCHYEEDQDGREAEERVGVLFERIQTAEYILRRAYLVQDLEVKVKPNKSYEWIMLATASLQ